MRSRSVTAAAGERARDRLPDERRVRGREAGHVAAGLVAPRPDVVDPGRARRRHRRLEVGDVVARQAEARQPELGADAVTSRGLGEERGEAADE